LSIPLKKISPSPADPSPPGFSFAPGTLAFLWERVQTAQNFLEEQL
jgi:hypothetical protein